MSLSSRPGMLGAFARFWNRTYAADYAALALVATGLILIQIFVHPFHRMFYVDDMAIRFPFSKVERVPQLWSIIYSAILPLIFLALWGLVTRPSAHKLHVTILGLAVSLILTPFITDIVKNAVGRPRPDLIERCQPEKGTPEHKLVTFMVCSQVNEHILQEAWRSFPSGHSSFGFAGLGYLSLFLAGQLHALRPRTDLARCLIAFVPLLGALMIAISRCEDYRHDVWDVTCGSLLGIAVAYFSYRRYYPPLRSPRCEIPYDKSDVALADGFSKLADDEERQERQAQRSDSAGWESPEDSFEGSFHMGDVAPSQSR